MKGAYIIILLALCLGEMLQAQTITADNERLETVLSRLEQASGYRIYWRKEDVKDVRVTCGVRVEDPIGINMGKLLANTELYYTTYGDKTVFVLKGQHLLTSLPAFAGTSGEGEDSSVSYLLGREQRKASSENVIYTVGDSRKKTSAQTVELRGTITSFKTGRPLMGVNITVKEPEWSAASSNA